MHVYCVREMSVDCVVGLVGDIFVDCVCERIPGIFCVRDVRRLWVCEISVACEYERPLPMRVCISLAWIHHQQQQIVWILALQGPVYSTK